MSDLLPRGDTMSKENQNQRMQLADVCRECWNIKYMIQKNTRQEHMHCLQEPELFWISFTSRLSVLPDGNSLLSQAQFYYSLTATNTLLNVMNTPTPLNINYINMAIGNLPSLQLPTKESLEIPPKPRSPSCQKPAQPPRCLGTERQACKPRSCMKINDATIRILFFPSFTHKIEI